NQHVPLASAELYDPCSGRWQSAGNMVDVQITPSFAEHGARYGHTATLLDNGKVLVVGGQYAPGSGPDATLASAELYTPDPQGGAGTWAPAGYMPSSTSGAQAYRAYHTATQLTSGPRAGSVL